MSSYGSGFDQLKFTIIDDQSGTQLLSRTFTSLTASDVTGAGVSYEIGALPTPLPATLLLMLSALGILGMWRPVRNGFSSGQ